MISYETWRLTHPWPTAETEAREEYALQMRNLQEQADWKKQKRAEGANVFELGREGKP